MLIWPRTGVFAGLIAGSISLTFAQTWQTVTPFPGSAGHERATAVTDGTVIWIVGGTPLDVDGNAPVHKYDPSNDYLAALSMPLEGGALDGGVAMDPSGNLLVFSGADTGGAEGDYYTWTEADGNNGGFAARTSQAPKQNFAIATDDDGLIYSIGGGPGASASGSNPNRNRVEVYDASVDHWTVLAPLPTAVADAGAAYDGAGHLVVVGGFTATGTRTANVAQYDVASKSWSDTAIDDLPLALSGARVVLGVDQRLYVIGGTNGTAQSSTWILDAGATSWHAGPSLSVARSGAACVLAGDDCIYVFGGSTDSGATGVNEKLATPQCPQVELQDGSVNSILGQPVGMRVVVGGAGPFSYQWRHNGVDLINGPQAGGSWVAGATTAVLGILGSSAADQGSYSCEVSNACGSISSTAAGLSLQAAPGLPSNLSSRSLHPAGAEMSRAWAVDRNQVAGDGLYPVPGFQSQYHPLVWDGARSATDMTPPNSIGGSVNAMRAGAKVGWFWWPYWTPQGTGYQQHACAWDAAGVLTELQPQGWEVGQITNTDGVHHVGWALYDADHSIAVDGVYWDSSTPFDYTFVASGGDFGGGGGNVGAIDNQQLFGVRFGSTPYDAVKWQRNTNQSWQSSNVAPSPSNGSFIQDAHSGLQAGRVAIGGHNEAGLWGGTGNAFVSLHPTGATSSEGTATRNGLQVGFAAFPGVSSHAMAWRGSASSALDLHSFAPAGFTWDRATDVDIDGFGTVTIVGYGSNSVTGRTEALEWRGNPLALSTDTPVVGAGAGATVHFTLFGGQDHAGLAWSLGAMGSFPVGSPATFRLPTLGGSFDDLGFAQTQIKIPAGTILATTKLNVRFVVRNPNGGVALYSNRLTVLLIP
ncbi:MAG: hypothetical protein H6830_01600 [Planctomycetes bacterium]|nr:hypothetical protein [Planctomycetota bacterium]MCB9910337.1 hypothetical protein [Planctomycetota bacterium]MCB9912052.1 hypothetical protein [Planctomycetota bacterium]HPF14502.1 hypothetical protein [Planctomycetota bacterium]HRV80710.1 hypothetical protein [Planctomycetota bacterium]